MTQLLIGLILFLGIHSLSIVAPGVRDRWAERLGVWTFKAVYSLVALAGFLLVWSGYSLARLEPTLLYVPPAGLRHLSALLMVPVFPLLLAAYFPGWISRVAKHPMLVAVKLWALAHLLANGMLADVVLFGSMLAWAVADRISLKRRAPRANPSAPAWRINDALVVLVGLALYVHFVMGAHARLFGVAPFSME
jgi:uncharacterized membrane protein